MQRTRLLTKFTLRFLGLASFSVSLAQAATPALETSATPAPRKANAVRADAFANEGTPANEPEPVRYILDAVTVHGNTRTDREVVLRYVPFKAGDVLDVDDPRLLLTRYRLLGTGFFRDVQLSLGKSGERDHVILRIDVEERNTLVISDVWMGLGADADINGDTRTLTAFGGIDAAETNLAGTGITLGSALGLAQDQLALRLRFLDPALGGSRWMTSGELLFNDARDFFGNQAVVWDDPNQLTGVPRHAVISYQRFGGSVGVGTDLSLSSQLWLHYRLESISDVRLPRAASHVVGGDIEPIDFSILPGNSVLSTLRGTLQHDTRDTPLLPTRGWFIAATAELSLAPFGNDYPYQRLDFNASHWIRLPWEHVVRLAVAAGGITGDAPFFEQYYVGDFSDFRPSRILGLNFDRRPAPNLLSTAIRELRYAEYAANIELEYRIPLYRGTRSVYGIDFFASTGVFGLASQRTLARPPRNYSGLARIPVDVNANLGFRIDTNVGGFVFAFSNILGFIPAFGEDNQ